MSGPTDAMVEAAAKELQADEWRQLTGPARSWADEPEHLKLYWRNKARSALSAALKEMGEG